MLAWWGGLPAVASLVVLLIFSWSEAKARGIHPATYLLGIVLCFAVFGLLVLLIGWIVYRVWGQSQLARTITFAVLMSAMALLGAGGALVSPAPRTVLAPPSDEPVATAFGAFEFEVPAGWTRVQPDVDKTKAMLMLNPNLSTGADGVLKVDVGRPTLPTAEQIAQSTAGQDGRVLPNSVLLDGAEGLRVETTATDLSSPRLVVVVLRGRRVYLIMAGARGETDVAGAFDHVLKTWRWRDGS